MSKGATVGLVIGIAALGVGAFFLLRKPAGEEKLDPLSNILAVAPGAITSAGSVVTAGQSTAANIIKSSINLATTPARTVLGAGKDLIKGLKFW